MRDFQIKTLNRDLDTEIQNKIDNLNKPKGSLGQIEELAFQLCRIQQTLSPTLSHPCHILFGADHGIEREGVSISPRTVTWQQMINFTKGGGGVNMFCRQHHFDLSIVDVGVDHDLTQYPQIINKKIANGTRNFLYEPAMNLEQFEKAIDIGADMIDLCISKGSNIISLGEMGIGNTSPSSVWMNLFGKQPIKDCIGIGSGLPLERLGHKQDILEKAISNFKNSCYDNTPEYIIRHFGGFEMVASIGAILRATERQITILIDGFIMSACILAASKLHPQVLEYAIFGHCGDEGGHRQMLQMMNAKPILNLGLRLGEGTGALCAYPIMESAVRMMNEMNNFQDANIDKYF